MSEPIDAFRYMSYIASRWRWIAGSCAAAMLAALIIGSAMTRQYTATARIVIDPPAGADLRAATTAISPIYLESLKTYETFASSDSLFQSAVEHFGLRSLFGARSIESLKKSVLKVAIVKNTRVLEISATLPDPKKAQALAQFVAESTVSLNRNLANQSDLDLIHGIEAEEAKARQNLDRVNARSSELQASEPVADLQAGVEASSDLRGKLMEQLLDAQANLAGSVAREKKAPETDLPQIRNEEAEAQARVDELRRQVADLDKRSAEREKLLGARSAHLEQIESERKSAQASFSAIETRLVQARGDVGYRGERLTIIDSGVAPERPSAPNMPLYLFAALLLGVALPVFYFAVEVNFRETRVPPRRGLRAVASNE